MSKDVIIALDFPTREETLTFLDRFPAPPAGPPGTRRGRRGPRCGFEAGGAWRSNQSASPEGPLGLQNNYRGPARRL